MKGDGTGGARVKGGNGSPNAIRFMEAVLRDAPIGVFLFGGDARVIYVNREAARDLGYSQKEILEKHIWDIDPSYDRKTFDAQMKQLRKKGVIKFKAIGISKTGKPIITEVTFNSVKSDGQDCCLAFAKDVGKVKIDGQKWARLNVLVEALDNALSGNAAAKG